MTCLLQICIVLFQQLHYYDTPSLVRSLREGRWAEALGGSRQTEPVSDAWCAAACVCCCPPAPFSYSCCQRKFLHGCGV